MRRRTVIAAAAVATAALGGGVAATQAGTDKRSVTERTTLDVTICPNERLCPTDDFTFLRAGPGEPHVVRQELAPAKDGRGKRRRSVGYFAQLSDFQLTDEESPARVEAIDDEPSGFASSAWRPQEAMLPHMVDRTVRQVNRFLKSPVTQGDGSRAPLLNAVLTGDLADSQQRNETEWVVRLLEGGRLDPNSGTKDRNGLGCQGPVRDIDNPRRYTGVQDYDDYPNPRERDNTFYDPDDPKPYDDGTWPRYPGLMDRAQAPFQAQGLKVPSYVAFGNHDNLVQGNEDAIRPFEDFATGCFKPLLVETPGGGDGGGGGGGDEVGIQSEGKLPSPAEFPDGLPPFRKAFERAYRQAQQQGRGGVGAQAVVPPETRSLLVPRDERRQFVDKVQSKRLYRTGKQPDQHGFGFVDPAEARASRGNASYYDFSPKPGIRYVIVDTVSEGGRTPDSSEGNIDDPQFRWLRGTLAAASRRNELIFVFSHHAPSSSQKARVADEEAPPCTRNDRHGHDQNPGCDRDPRASTPIRLGGDTIRLLHQFPHVVAYIAGHSHENQITPIKDDRGRGFWEIKSPAIADWTTHHRLLEVMDNRDGTLSLFGTLLDFAAPVRAPGSGSDASVFNASTLASIGRTLTYNDPQQGPDGSEGEREDRNVELLLRDPRRSGGGGSGGAERGEINGTPGDDVLRGTSRDDVIRCGGGNDVVYAESGNDVVDCGPGDDVIYGGSGEDRLSGGDGDDRIHGNSGDDRLSGGSGNDRLHGDSGDDRIDGGPGRDRGFGDTGRDSFAAVEERRQDS